MYNLSNHDVGARAFVGLLSGREPDMTFVHVFGTSGSLVIILVHL
jgi:hypothetical protein